MNSLDPRTIIHVASLTCGLMGLLLYLMRRSYPQQIGGLGYWTVAATLWFVGATLIATRLPVFFTAVVADIILLVGTLLYHVGCRAFFGLQTRWRPWSVFLMLVATGLVSTLYVPQGHGFRTILFAFAATALYLINLALLSRHGDKRLPVRLLQVGLVIQTVVVLWRMINLSWDPGADTVLQRAPPQLIFVSSFAITHFFFTVGVVLLATGRLVSELENLAQNDPLTRLPNRRTLFERMENEMARAQRNGRGPALLMLDLDHFKNVNDTRGHQHGDQVLIHFAGILRAQLRKMDYVGRYGGEEFIAMLPNTDQATALEMTRRIHAATDSDHPLANPVSIGLTTWNGPEDTLDALIARADSAVYQAKAQGRNRTCMT